MSDSDSKRRLPSGKAVLYGLGAFFLVVIILAIITVRSGDDAADKDAAEAASSSSSTPVKPRPAPGQGDVDALGRPVVVPTDQAGDPLDQDGDPSSASARNPLSKPRGLQWQLVYGVPAPFSSSDGPRAITDGTPGGIAQTPQGAVIAALQIEARSRFGPRQVRERIVRDFTVGGTPELRKEILDIGDVLSLSIDIPGLEESEFARESLVPAAVRIRAGNWSKEAATIDLAYGPQRLGAEAPDDDPDATAYFWRSLSVVWTGEHWALKATPELAYQEPNKAGSIASLDGGEWATWI